MEDFFKTETSEGELAEENENHSTQEEEENESPEEDEYSEDSEDSLSDKESLLEEYKKQLKREKKEKYRLLKEAHEINNDAHFWKDRAASLEQYTEYVSDANLMEYDRNLSLELERVLDLKRKASEEGDVDESLAADMELARLSAKRANLESYYGQRHLQQQQYLDSFDQQAYQQAYQQNYNQRQMNIPVEAQEWLMQNSWFVPGAKGYDPGRSQKLHSYLKELDQKWIENGKADEFFSPEYLHEVNKYISRNLNGGRAISMKSVHSHVSPVNSRSSFSSSPRKERISLSEEEKTMARKMGVSEKAWIEQKIGIQRNEKGNNRYGRY